MLPPIYLLLLLWPTCPLVPARHKVVKPLETRPGTYWLRRLASLDPMRELPVMTKFTDAPLHIKHHRRHLNMAFGVSPSLLGHRSALAIEAAASIDTQRRKARRAAMENFVGAGRPSPVPDVIVIDDVDVAGVDIALLRRKIELALAMPPACVEYITAQKSPPTPPRSRLARAVRAVQNYRTPRTGQKPWRRPRGLSSAAHRRQNTRRKHK